jgi:hypothetical protein
LQDIPKFTIIGLFGLKIYYLATLLQSKLSGFEDFTWRDGAAAAAVEAVDGLTVGRAAAGRLGLTGVRAATSGSGRGSIPVEGGRRAEHLPRVCPRRAAPEEKKSILCPFSFLIINFFLKYAQ